MVSYKSRRMSESLPRLHQLADRFTSESLHVVYDENILGLEAFFENHRLTPLAGRSITRDDLLDADILIVRSVTRVDKTLLDGTSVRFVGTCTIGIDHLDISFLEQNQIVWASAPGCNANAVVQYVVCALVAVGALSFNAQSSRTEAGTAKSIAIIGCGNVGGRVGQVFSELGHSVRCVDPFLSKAAIGRKRMEKSSLAACEDADIICCHTPLTTSGDHPSFEMLDRVFFEALKPGAVLVNAGRGAIVSTAVLESLTPQLLAKKITLILDVWPDEPEVDRKLAQHVKIATPHIAGYSLEGKVYGTTMILRELLSELGATEKRYEALIETIHHDYFGSTVSLDSTTLDQAILSVYNPKKDHERFMTSVSRMPAAFDALRKEYPLRREFGHFNLDPKALTESEMTNARALGFL